MEDKNSKIGIVSDHAGYNLKSYIISYLSENKYNIFDFGTHSELSVDYPDYAHKLGEAVNNGDCKIGIAICGSGNGVNMVVNKYPNVRGALVWSSEQSELTRKHNNANIISLPGRFINFDEAIKAIKLFLNTDFEGGRHEIRVKKIPIPIK